MVPLLWFYLFYVLVLNIMLFVLLCAYVNLDLPVSVSMMGLWFRLQSFTFVKRKLINKFQVVTCLREAASTAVPDVGYI